MGKKHKSKKNPALEYIRVNEGGGKVGDLPPPSPEEEEKINLSFSEKELAGDLQGEVGLDDVQVIRKQGEGLMIRKEGS